MESEREHLLRDMEEMARQLEVAEQEIRAAKVGSTNLELIMGMAAVRCMCEGMCPLQHTRRRPWSGGVGWGDDKQLINGGTLGAEVSSLLLM